jgi:hypothetical protein
MSLPLIRILYLDEATITIERTMFGARTPFYAFEVWRFRGSKHINARRRTIQVPFSLLSPSSAMIVCLSHDSKTSPIHELHLLCQIDNNNFVIFFAIGEVR